MLNSGISFNRFLRPYLISSIFLAIFSFYLSNFLIPPANENRREFKDKYMEKLTKLKDRNIHLQISPGEFVYVQNFSVATQTGFKFTLEKFEKDELKYKLSAERITWDTAASRWHLTDYFVRVLAEGKETLLMGNAIDTTLALLPQDLYIQKEDYEIMDYWELNDKIKMEKMKGSEIVKSYEVEKGKRLASPFAIIVMALIGVSLSSRKLRGGIGMHLGMGLGIAFAYILFMQISTVFATFGNLSPLYAAWIPNIIFSIIGIYLLQKAPK
jgi:lipopolysaccharide export system permease protein